MKYLVLRLLAALLTFTLGVAAVMIWMNHPFAPAIDRQVVGKWITDPDDIHSIHTHGRINLEFNEESRGIFRRFPDWIYETPILSGRVQDGMIIVDYPALAKGKIKYTVEQGGKLSVDFGSFHSTYIRADQNER